MRPYVSFVTWGRNDGYVPDFAGRLSTAIATLAGQLEAAALESEILVSEWNPPAGRPLLLDTIRLPARYRFVTVRGVVAGPEFHARFAGAAEQGMHNGEAWNAGIRRARGKFITPKASDTFYSPEIVTRIAQRDLREDRLYRVDRYDVQMPDDRGIDALWSRDPATLPAALAALPATQNKVIEQLPQWRLRPLHTNAAGDFLLMSRASWHRLRGHPFDPTTLTLDGDSLIMHAAAALGIEEERWLAPAKVYKPRRGDLNNARIAEVWQPWQRTLDRLLADHVSVRLAHRARMAFDYPKRKVRGIESVLAPSIERQFVQPASRWAQGARPVPTQPENWGLADETLEERVLNAAAWEEAGTTHPA